MNRFFTTLLIAVGAGLAVYAARARFKLAITVAVTVYLVLLPLRLLFAVGSLGDRIDDLIWPALILLVLWAVLARVSIVYQRRKRAQEARRPPSRSRRGGWLRGR